MKFTIRRLPLSLAMIAALAFAPLGAAQQPDGTDDKPASEQPASESAEAAPQDSDKPAEASEPPKAAAEKDGEAEKEKAAARKLKIFELKHRSPQEMQQIVALLRNPRSRLAATGIGNLGQVSFGGTSGAVPGSLPPPHDPQAASQPLVAADAETKLLFVRGTDEHIQQIEDMVKAFDVVEDNFTSQQFGDVMLIKVEKGQAGRVHGLLSQLQLGSQMVHIGPLSLIAIRTGPSDQDKAAAEQAQQVIAMIQEKKEAKTEEASGEKDKADEAKSEEAKKEEAKTDEEKSEERKDEEKQSTEEGDKEKQDKDESESESKEDKSDDNDKEEKDDKEEESKKESSET